MSSGTATSLSIPVAAASPVVATATSGANPTTCWPYLSPPPRPPWAAGRQGRQCRRCALRLPAAEAGGLIYVFGGFGPTGARVATAEAYDPASDNWHAIKPMPIALDHLAAAALGGKVYVFGGAAEQGESNRTFMFDPASGEWAERARMPTARAALAAVTLGDRIYVVGGTNSHANEAYDPAANQWTVRAQLPTARDHLAVAAANGRLYVIGGRVAGNSTNNLNVNEMYDPAANRWTTQAPLPTAAQRHWGGIPQRQDLRSRGRDDRQNLRRERDLRPISRSLDSRNAATDATAWHRRGCIQWYNPGHRGWQGSGW